MAQSESSNLWRLTRSGQPIDANAFAVALVEEAQTGSSDYRTELLIRDGMEVLCKHWGMDRTQAWLASHSQADKIRKLWSETAGPTGFATLSNRIMDTTSPQTVLSFFRELGTRVQQPARLEIGESTSLILAELLSRQTDDIDVVDEVPADVRLQHELLEELSNAYGLKLTHFQSHYLPDGWRDRLKSLGRFGKLDVLVVDVYDMLVSKLTSARRKDRDDLRAVGHSIDRQVLAARLKQFGATLLAEPKLAENARNNWYIVYGEELPVG